MTGFYSLFASGTVPEEPRPAPAMAFASARLPPTLSAKATSKSPLGTLTRQALGLSMATVWRTPIQVGEGLRARLAVE